MARRGFDPLDAKWFSKDAIAQMHIAQQEVQWLLDRGYQISSVIDLIGGHYQLSSRQRTALQRATASTRQCAQRKASRLPFESGGEGCLFIDGFNLIITLEVALSGSVLILGNDDVLRDLAGLRGTYRLIGQTDRALFLIGQTLAELGVPAVKFYLDAPVSNSGKLRSRILEAGAGWKMPVEVELVPNADIVLYKLQRIVTGDSILLDQGASWMNLSRKIIDDSIKDAWIVTF